jgi:hypothetical protein
VVITVAKKNDVSAGLGQNIAQIKCGREDYIHHVLGDRKVDDVDVAVEISSVPSFGAVSTADKWVFTLLEGRTVYCTDVFPVLLSDKCSAADVRRSMDEVVRQLVGILHAQKQAVDANCLTREMGRVGE